MKSENGIISPHSSGQTRRRGGKKWQGGKACAELPGSSCGQRGLGYKPRLVSRAQGHGQPMCAKEPHAVHGTLTSLSAPNSATRQVRCEIIFPDHLLQSWSRLDSSTFGSSPHLGESHPSLETTYRGKEIYWGVCRS
jgi:hypothetical protein